MALTYPLTPPTALKVANARWTAKSVVAVNASPYTGQQQVLAQTGEWWEVDLEVPVRNRADADALEAFLLSMRGRLGTCYLGDRLRTTPRGTATGRTLASAVAANTSSFPIGTAGSGDFAVGDWIKITGSNQIFRVLAKTSSVAGGTYEVFPKTRTAFNAFTAVHSWATASVLGVFRLKAEVPFQVRPDKLFGPYTIPLIEAF